MSPDEVRHWLDIGDGDLAIARHVAEAPDLPTTVGCFLCQQAVEKYLKASLLFNGERPPRTHNLLYLLELTGPFLPVLDTFKEQLARLSPFAIEGRYPITGDPPPNALLKEFIDVAAEIGELLKSEISTTA